MTLSRPVSILVQVLALSALGADAASRVREEATLEPRSQRRDSPTVSILPSGTKPPEPLVNPGPEPDVEILFTSEVRGYYQPCG